MTAPQDAVHQINFGLQPDEGVVVVGGTMSDEDKLLWLRRLQVHVRLQRFGSTLPPERALSTFEFPDGNTAVLRRWNSGGTIGRNDAMALIDRSFRLPLPVVLGLDRRFGWDAAAQQRPLQMWDADQVQVLGEEGARELRDPAKREPDMLRRALTRLLDAPSQPLTIVGCPDAQRIPLLWGLHRLAAPRLLQQNVRRPWTFSTYEMEDADSIRDLPAVVFLPERPAGATVSRRKLVDVREDQSTPSPNADRAARYVEAFLQNREDKPEIEAALPAPPPPTSGSTPGRTPYGGDGATVVDPRPPGGNGWPRSGSRRPESRPEAVPVPVGAGWSDLSAAVDRIQQASGRAELNGGMAWLESLTMNPNGRAALRDQLGASRYATLAVAVVRHFPDERDKDAGLRRLHALTFGPGMSDLREPAVRDFAVNVLDKHPSPKLGQTVIAALLAVHEPAQVHRVLAERWLDERGLLAAVVSEPADPPVPAADVPPLPEGPARTSRWSRLPVLVSGRPAAAGRHADDPATESKPGSRAPAWALAALAAGVVVLALLVFLSWGFITSLVGPGEPAAAPATPPPTVIPDGTGGTPATSAAASQTPTPEPTPDPTREVRSATAPEQGGTVGAGNLTLTLPTTATSAERVYLLLRRSGTVTYYYYGECTAQAETETRDQWFCGMAPGQAPPRPSGSGTNAGNGSYEALLVQKLPADPARIRDNAPLGFETPVPESDIIYLLDTR